MVKMNYKERLSQIQEIEDINLKKQLIFYLQTSAYTYLGPYTEFVQKLPDDLKKLCTLQRMQTIHAKEFFDNKNIRKDKNNANGDMTKIPVDRMNNEEDIFQTAINIFAELLRRNSKYTVNRKAKDIMDMAYDKDMSEGEYLQDCVSRKKNVVPVIMASFEK